MSIRSRAAIGLALAAALGGAAGLAQAQEAAGRVISSTPIRDGNGQTSYSVTYEYAGRQYTTRMDSPPGRTIPLQVSPLGVTTSPVPDQPQIADNSNNSNSGGSPWESVVPEPGMVVGAGGPPAPVYGAPAYAPPVYGAPVYAPPPVYVQPAYGYAAPYYVGPPVGLSLNFGYSRGWHRGWR